MFEPQFSLQSRFLTICANELVRTPANQQPWETMAEVLGSTRTTEPDLAAAIDARDLGRMRTIVDLWSSGRRPLPEQDRGVLERAMKAYRKSLKTVQTAEGAGQPIGPIRGARPSWGGILPPAKYPREVWTELARQGRLVDARQGVYELPPGR